MGQSKVKVTDKHQHQMDAVRTREFPKGWVGWVDPDELASLQEAGKCKLLHGDAEEEGKAPTDPVFKIADKKWGVQGSDETYATKKAAQAAYDELTGNGDGDVIADGDNDDGGDGANTSNDTVSGSFADEPASAVQTAAQDANAEGNARVSTADGNTSEAVSDAPSSDDT